MKCKRYIIGIIMFVFILENSVFATEVDQTNEIVFNKINIEVNGQKVEADNILYNNTTYVPLRKVAEMLGKEVKWNEETNTAGISDKAQNTIVDKDIKLKEEERKDSQEEININDSFKENKFIGYNYINNPSMTVTEKISAMLNTNKDKDEYDICKYDNTYFPFIKLIDIKVKEVHEKNVVKQVVIYNPNKDISLNNFEVNIGGSSPKDYKIDYLGPLESIILPLKICNPKEVSQHKENELCFVLTQELEKSKEIKTPKFNIKNLKYRKSDGIISGTITNLTKEEYSDVWLSISMVKEAESDSSKYPIVVGWECIKVKKIPLMGNVNFEIKSVKNLDVKEISWKFFNNKYIDGENVNVNTVFNSLDNAQDITEYLQTNYSTLETSNGATSFTYEVWENDSIMQPYDYHIFVNYDSDFFYDVKYSNSLNNTTRNKVKRELKKFQEELAKDLIAKFPDKKITGQYHDSWYRYPNLRVDLIVRRYYTWTNYNEPDLLSNISKYEQTKPGSFRWYPFIDDEL